MLGAVLVVVESVVLVVFVVDFSMGVLVYFYFLFWCIT